MKSTFRPCRVCYNLNIPSWGPGSQGREELPICSNCLSRIRKLIDEDQVEKRPTEYPDTQITLRQGDSVCSFTTTARKIELDFSGNSVKVSLRDWNMESVYRVDGGGIDSITNEEERT